MKKYMVIYMMIKLIKLEWIKFVESRKNRMVIVLIFLFLLGLLSYNQIQYKNYFTSQEKSMIEQKRKANSSLNIINLLIEKDKEYKENPEEILFLEREEKNSLMLEYYYKNFKVEDSTNILKTQNEKFENLIFGESNGFIKTNILKARGQSPISVMRYISQNTHIIDNDIQPIINPYKLNRINFLLILLKGYTPLILIIFAVLLSIDIFSSEMEEGSYKLHFTQPFSRKSIYWAKILSGVFFSLGVLFALISLFFLVISLTHGIGEYYYPEAIASSKILLSFTSKIQDLGQFDIVSRAKLIVIGYLLMFIVCLSLMIFTIFISIVLNSTTKTLGVFTSIILINLGIDIFLKEISLFRVYFPFSYTNIERVIYGEISSSYILGITMSIFIIISLSIAGERIIDKSDLLGGEM